MHSIRAHVSLVFVTPALALVLAAVGCSSSNTDCRGNCDSVHVTCRQRCTDDTCRTQCDTDLNDCTVHCTSTPAGDGGH